MKKILTLSVAAVMSLCAFAEKGAIMLKSPAQMQVMAVSPNGKWACGIIGDGVYTTPQAALWNLQTGEVTYLSNEESYAQDVTDEGLVVGSYTNYELSGTGAGAVVAGYYYNGEWTAFDNDQLGFVSQPGGEAFGVSADGRRAVGNVVSADGKYVPAMWEDGKLIKLLPVKHEQGRAYAISEDGTMATGWAYDRDSRNSLNRMVALWRGDSIQNLSSQSSAWEAGIRFSPDGTKIVCNAMGYKFTYDLTTDQKTELPWLHPACWSQEMSYIGNDGLVMGGESYQDMTTGASDMYGYIFDGTNAMRLDDWLRDNYNVDIPTNEFLISRGIDMSVDRKVIAILGYELQGQGDHSSRIILLDREVDFCEPVALRAEKLTGVNSVRLTWNAPLANVENVLGYNLYRNQELIAEGLGEFAYIDSNLADGTYTYTVTALYADENDEIIESAHSVAATAIVGEDPLNVVTNIETHPVNYNDLKLRWSAPASNLPYATYFDANSTVGGLGGGLISFSAAILLPYDVVADYADNFGIARVAFMPRNHEAIYTVKVIVNEVEVASKTLNTADLVINDMNTIDLDAPVRFEALDNVMIAIDVDASQFTNSSNDVIGMNYGIVTLGFSDLLRQLTEPEYYSVGAQMPLSWAISAIFATIGEDGKADVSSDIIEGYEVYRNGELVGNTTETAFQDNNLPEGTIEYGVVTQYQGKKSEAATHSVEFAPRIEALKAINDVEVFSDLTFVDARWCAPINNDATFITYSNGISSGRGINKSGSKLFEFTAAQEYSYTFLEWYVGYTIESLRFYPTAEAIFAIVLEVDGVDHEMIVLGEMGAEDGYVLNTWNDIKLSEPIKIVAGSTYRVKLVCSEVTPNNFPICMDTSITIPGVSDMYSWDYSSYSSVYMDGGLSGSWMLGMNIHNDNTDLLPVSGYNVLIDGEQANTELVTDTRYRQDGLSLADKSTHRVKINAVYNVNGTDVEIDGQQVVFNVTAGVESLEIDRVKVYPNPATSFIKVEGETERIALVDMAGRVVAETTEDTIDVTTLPVGNYLLNIYEGGEVRIVKVLIAR